MVKKIVLFLLFCSWSLLAHPPKSLDLSYDAEKAELAVKVWHKVSNPQGHFISKIVVFLDKEAIAEKTFDAQQTDTYQEHVFSFSENPLKAGDPVHVRAYCSLSGKKNVDLEWK